MNLLPPNSTALERALATVTNKRFDQLPVPIRSLWNADSCPVDLLGWLAWAVSVDVWRDEWSEAQKREAIRSSFFVHTHKGTIGAVRRALDALAIGIEIREWFQTGDAAGTFRIDAFADYIFVAGFGINPALLDIISAQIDSIKPARAHYTLRVGERFTTRQPVRTGVRGKARSTATHEPEPRNYQALSRLSCRTALRTKRVHRFEHDVLVRIAA